MIPNQLISETKGKHLSSKDIRNELLSDHEWVIIQLCKEMNSQPRVEDLGAVDFLAEPIESHTKKVIDNKEDA